ncbi:MAG: hypothetical protein ACREMY_32050 [bacterium]
MKEFDHIGIITTEQHPDESWVPFAEVWVTNPRLHPQRIEYLRARNPPQVDPKETGLWKLWNLPHVAYRVDNLAAAIEGEELIIGPFEPGEFGSVAFVHKDGAVIEYMEYTRLDVWFGQPTPWKPAGPTQSA